MLPSNILEKVRCGVEKKVPSVFEVELTSLGCSFPSRTFCRAGLVDMYCLNLVLSSNILFSPSIMIESFAGLGKFSSMILLNMFSAPLSWISSPSSIPIVRFGLFTGFSHVLFEVLYHFSEYVLKVILFWFICIVMFRSCWCMVPSLRWSDTEFSVVGCAFTLSSSHPSFWSSIDSEPALVLGPLKSAQELRREQQLAEIETRRQEREKTGKEKGEEGRARPPGQEMVDELQGPFSYDFSYWARSGEKITVTPSSKELLFYPPSMEATVSGESCPGKLIEIHGKAGLFLEGQIHPELEGVEIVISEKGASSPLITVFTDDKGAYSVGPLHSDLEYTVTSQKEGYVLTAVEGTVGDFKAYALAGVSFEIKAEDDQPLPGVLLSLSGGVFRSNLLTQDNGVLTFSNLSPGQYYFKPMMKEFRFEPSSQMIEVQEGQNLRITITGFRTAYSCYGTVSSLNGEPEQGVAVEAVGQKDCSIYGEDTVTDEEGKFRLRGLLPGCMYHVQLKAEGNDHIERALPHHRVIEVGNNDVDDVNIIVFRQINQFDLSGNVITSSEYLSTLWVKLYRSENLDNPIQTVSLGQSLFFHFPPLLRDGENYVVLLDSTLSRSQYDYVLPQVSFTAVGYHKHITLVFSPTRKLPEQDIAQGSYIALPLTLLLLLAGYNHDKLIPLLLQLTSRLQGVRALGQVASDSSGPEDMKRQTKKQKTRRTCGHSARWMDEDLPLCCGSRVIRNCNNDRDLIPHTLQHKQSVISVFDLSHSDLCKMESQSCFDLYFPDD
ncbi:nodal modulator 1 precursor [Cricetulus griseus]|nr:nodal modulator 1 precursor [Cricetulus griseus]